MKKDKPDGSLKKINRITLRVVGLVVILWLANANLRFFFDSQTSGQIGDTFGAVNSLFSGLAFVGLIYAIFLQRHEITLQREDLRLQHQELKATREEFSIQNETLKQQRFENTFFSMLSLHNEVMTSLVMKEVEGRGVFKYLQGQTEPSIFAPDKNDSEHVQRIMNVMKHNQSVTGHYFRNLYRIFIFIDESDIENKSFYAKIVRAQLSDDELKMLYCNCYFNERGDKFQKYAERYNLFDNLPDKEDWEGLRKAAAEEQASQ